MIGLLCCRCTARALRAWVYYRSWCGVAPAPQPLVLLHAAGNAVVCAMTAPAFVGIWRAPDTTIYVPRDVSVPYVPPVDGLWIAMLHLYHVVCFNDVPWSDMLHHVLFVPYSQACWRRGCGGGPRGGAPACRCSTSSSAGCPGWWTTRTCPPARS